MSSLVCLSLKRAAVKAVGLPHGIVQVEREDMEHAAIEALRSCIEVHSGALIAFLTAPFSCVILSSRSDEEAVTDNAQTFWQ